MKCKYLLVELTPNLSKHRKVSRKTKQTCTSDGFFFVFAMKRPEALFSLCNWRDSSFLVDVETTIPRCELLELLSNSFQMSFHKRMRLSFKYGPPDSGES